MSGSDKLKRRLAMRIDRQVADARARRGRGRLRCCGIAGLRPERGRLLPDSEPFAASLPAAFPTPFRSDVPSCPVGRTGRTDAPGRNSPGCPVRFLSAFAARAATALFSVLKVLPTALFRTRSRSRTHFATASSSIPPVLALAVFSALAVPQAGGSDHRRARSLWPNGAGAGRDCRSGRWRRQLRSRDRWPSRADCGAATVFC